MKKILMLFALAASLVAVAAPDAKTMSLADARTKIGEVIKNPAMMTKIMKQLSADDQKTFVADVNAAISKMPASNEERTAMLLNVNKAAMRGASKGNLAAVVAEVFATAPVESLAVLNESFAADLFNRDADPSNPVSDEQFEKISADLMQTVNERTAKTDDGAVRSSFAIAMMVNASNGSMPELGAKLADTLPESVRETAKNEWIPAATKEGDKNYDSMLGAADAGAEPNTALTLKIAGPQYFEAMLADISTMPVDGTSFTPMIDIVFAKEALTVPPSTDLDIGIGGSGGGSTIPQEPQGYQNQTTGR